METSIEILLFGCCPTALVNILKWPFSTFSSYRAEATEIWKMGKFWRVAWSTRAGYKSEHSHCLYLLSGETTVKGIHSNEGTFFNILKLYENIPSISKTIEHTPPPHAWRGARYSAKTKTTRDRQTARQTGAFQYLPSRAFGAR